MRAFWRETWRQVGIGLVIVGGFSSAGGGLFRSSFAGQVALLSGGSACILGAVLVLIGAHGGPTA